MKIRNDQAEAVFRAEAAASVLGNIDEQWREKIQHLSELCPAGKGGTHIAFFGTSILAKAVDATVDLRTVKPEQFPGNPRAYSARVLSEQVLVPLAAEYGVHIGTTGKQPLNNQPYFRIAQIGDGTPIHGNSQDAFDYMVGLIQDLQATTTTTAARKALRAYIAVRRGYQPRYGTAQGALSVTAASLASLIQALVSEGSEGGKRAQGAAAGLMDVFAGSERVESGRINDPSRHYPGDVCVKAPPPSNITWEKAIEVRDKPVSEQDVRIFCNRCLLSGVREAAVLMVSGKQPTLPDLELQQWAATQGIGLTLFYGWHGFVEQVLFWAALPKLEAAQQAVGRVEARLIAVEASSAAVSRWQDLVRAQQP